jgi:hypothetical protein
VRMTGGLRVRSVPRTVAAALVALAVALGGATLAASAIGGAPHLEPITPARLLAAVIRTAANPPDVSGTVNARLDLGLPSLPQQGPAPTGIGGLLASLTGDHRIRVWSSADGYRVDELLPTAERAIYVAAHGGWLWDSGSYTAYELYDAAQLAALRKAAEARGAAESADETAERRHMMQLSDPLTLAREALRALTPTTSVAIGQAERVAGRPAYILVLTPKDRATLVGRVEVAVDAATHVPLAVRVYAKDAASPAASTAFASVSFGPVSPSVYEFTPPPGATVKELYQGRRLHKLGPRRPPTEISTNPAAAVRVFGHGWSTVVAIRLPAASLASAGSEEGVDVRQLLPFSGPLFSARRASAGAQTWLLAGAVPQATLAAAESKLH